MIFPSSKTQNHVYIKELTFKSSNYEGFNIIAKQVKEIQKRLKLKMTAHQAYNDNTLILRKKIKTIPGLQMRPTL